jgi:4,5-dihydroxyphthalate decarboxylase
MSTRIPLTLACGDYAITRALKEGAVRPDGIDLTVLTDMDSTTRHWRFLRNREFDVAEVSCSSYVAARDRDLPFRAIPVFLHRRFRHGFVFINTAKGIRTPTDLIGRKVGVKAFLVTAVLWMRGILEHEYGVPHKSIEWFAEIDEDVDFAPPPDLKLTRLPHAQSVEAMLATGELDAVLHSDLIKPFVAKDPRVARLFPDYKREEIAYYRKTGVFPIMHVMGFRQEIVERHPWVPLTLYRAFNEAKAIAMKRMENPRIVPLAWYRDAWEEQEEILGPDPWEYGLSDRNRKTLETLVGYSHEHGLIKRKIPLDELFLNVSPGRKRGDDFRI